MSTIIRKLNNNQPLLSNNFEKIVIAAIILTICVKYLYYNLIHLL